MNCEECGSSNTIKCKARCHLCGDLDQEKSYECKDCGVVVHKKVNRLESRERR